MDITIYKQKLEAELSRITERLQSVGRINPQNTSDWEAKEGDDNIDPAEEGEIAEGMENFETNRAILFQLETELNEIKQALSRIEKGTYGTCSVCGKEIETDRLMVQPAAGVCEQHMNN